MSGLAATVARVWDRFFFTGGTAERLGMLRIILGLGMVPFHALQFASFWELRPMGPHWHYIEPIWYFRALGVEALDPLAAQAAFVVVILASFAFAAGLFTRASLTVMLLCVVYLKGARDSVAGDIHHRYLMPVTVLFFMLLSPCGEVLSLDERRARRKGRTLRPIEEWEASWPIKASQLYVCSFYFWSAIAKARMSGLAWAEPERIQTLLTQRAVRYGFTHGEPAGSSLAYQIAQNEFLSGILAGMTYVFEFGFPLILFIRNPALRWAFFIGVSFFHVANFVLADVKFLFLPVLFAIFFDVSVPLHWWRARHGRGGGGGGGEAGVAADRVTAGAGSAPSA
jgi:hypothetical protein